MNEYDIGLDMQSAYDDGYRDGRSDGYDQGYDDGYERGFIDGLEARRNEASYGR